MITKTINKVRDIDDLPDDLFNKVYVARRKAYWVSQYGGTDNEIRFCDSVAEAAERWPERYPTPLQAWHLERIYQRRVAQVAGATNRYEYRCIEQLTKEWGLAGQPEEVCYASSAFS